MGLIFDIKKYAIHDGPGIRTTIFLKGCPLTCWWCHNPEGIRREPEFMWSKERCLHCEACVNACPKNALSFSPEGDLNITMQPCNTCTACVTACHAQALELIGKEMTVEEVMKEIEKDTIFYDESKGGVTFSGGEPLMQPDFVYNLLKTCKERAIHTALDTCGYAPPDILKRISSITDLFLYDVKVINDEIHKKATGVSNALILENLKMLSRMKKDIIVRIPLIPGINDDEKSITDLGEFVSALHVKEVSILPYHKSGLEKMRKLKKTIVHIDPPSPEKITALEKKLISYGLHVKRGG
jgi:pyruvate formate lyase activating enzyme